MIFHIFPVETLQTRKSKIVDSLQAVTVSTHRNNIVAKGQGSKVERQTIRKDSNIFPAQ
jgi:hypothetical protein